MCWSTCSSRASRSSRSRASRSGQMELVTARRWSASRQACQRCCSALGDVLEVAVFGVGAFGLRGRTSKASSTAWLSLGRRRSGRCGRCWWACPAGRLPAGRPAGQASLARLTAAAAGPAGRPGQYRAGGAARLLVLSCQWCSSRSRSCWARLGHRAAVGRARPLSSSTRRSAGPRTARACPAAPGAITSASRSLRGGAL